MHKKSRSGESERDFQFGVILYQPSGLASK